VMLICATGRTLSAGMASAASLALLSPGSSAHAPNASLLLAKEFAIPAGVAAFRSNQRISFIPIFVVK
ncbi:hypothetical protein, partial [Sporosarcina sp. USHLN248]|uniref:hypothetical protein n=1 Tax=Sporosarcina sp. USHLN248 TaxID=3081300 RepID=UPI00301B60AB